MGLKSGGHMGPPLRVVIRVLVVGGPARRVVADVLSDVVQFGFVTDDPLVIIALPQPAGERWPIPVFYAVDIGVGGHRFKPLHDLR